MHKLNYRIKTFNDGMVNNTNNKLVSSEEWLQVGNYVRTIAPKIYQKIKAISDRESDSEELLVLMHGRTSINIKCLSHRYGDGILLRY